MMIFYCSGCRMLSGRCCSEEKQRNQHKWLAARNRRYVIRTCILANEKDLLNLDMNLSSYLSFYWSISEHTAPAALLLHQSVRHFLAGHHHASRPITRECTAREPVSLFANPLITLATYVHSAPGNPRCSSCESRLTIKSARAVSSARGSDTAQQIQ